MLPLLLLLLLPPPPSPAEPLPVSSRWNNDATTGPAAPPTPPTTRAPALRLRPLADPLHKHVLVLDEQHGQRWVHVAGHTHAPAGAVAPRGGVTSSAVVTQAMSAAAMRDMPWRREKAENCMPSSMRPT